MSNPRHHFVRLALSLAAVPALGLGLVACGGEEVPPEESTTVESTVSSSVSAEPESTSRETEGSTSSSTSDNTTTQRTSEGDVDKGVAEVSEEFSSLAPASLFSQFDSCNPSGLEGSWQCSGSEVGQFQFFSGSAKAASTTQLLTELRSSRVVEDTGDRVVGWSTLGTTAVITVVDNDRGLVMQQMVSSDREDPEDLIYELGLAEPTASDEAETTTPSSGTRGSGEANIEEA